MAELVLTERRDQVVIVTFSDPSRMNPFSDEMRAAALATLQTLSADRSCRAVILAGAAGNFSAGADIRQMEGAALSDPDRARARLAPLHGLVRLIAAGPKPVIAAVEGVAFGAGLSIAAACDYVIAAQGSRFGAGFGKIGLTADCGLLWSLPRRIGERAVRELLLTGRTLTCEEAEGLGLVDLAVPKGAAVERAREKAREYACVAPLSIAAVKAGLARDLDAVLELENEQQPKLLASRDHAEGKAAFGEKRAPIWSGE